MDLSANGKLGNGPGKGYRWKNSLMPRRNREPFWISNFGLTKRRSVSVLIVEVTKAAKPRGIFGLL
jgi:hypothetical protein